MNRTPARSGRSPRACAAAVLTLAALSAPGPAFGQGMAGKIEGTVRDQAGAPIGGAQVLIAGSAFHSVTNERGYYFINHVPAVMLTVRGSLTFPHGWGGDRWYGALLRDAGFFATFRLASGLPYTRMVNTGVGVRGPGNPFTGVPAEPLNASRTPWIRNVDLRVTRAFRLGAGRQITAFADCRNLFNWTNLAAIFAETGTDRNEMYEDEQLTDVRVTLNSEAGALVVSRSVTRGGIPRTLTGIDLSDCSACVYGPDATRGMPDCLLLRGAERRFGDGDRFFDTEEQDASFQAYYDALSGPHTLRGPGFNMRVGFELGF